MQPDTEGQSLVAIKVGYSIGWAARPSKVWTAESPTAGTFSLIHTCSLVSADKPDGTVPLRLLDWRFSVDSAVKDSAIIQAGGSTPVRLLKERSREARSRRAVQEGGSGPERSLREVLRARRLVRRAKEASGRVCVHKKGGGQLKYRSALMAAVHGASHLFMQARPRASSGHPLQTLCPFPYRGQEVI